MDDDFIDIMEGKDRLSGSASDTKLELARQLFVSLESQILLADRKVQAVFGLNAFLVAALSLQNQRSLQSILSAGLTVNVVLDLFLKISFLICVSIATWSAVGALTPRVRQKVTTSGQQKSSLFFFNDIKAQTFREFSSAFRKLTHEEALEELLGSAYALSGILQIKYKMLKRSIFFISLALLVWILLQINKFTA